MKNAILVLLVLSPFKLFAMDPLCTSQAGEFLGYNLSSSVFMGSKNNQYYPELKKQLSSKYKNLCQSQKHTQEIISEMYSSCVTLTLTLVKKEEQKDLHIEACDLAFRVAEAYAEGMIEGSKMSRSLKE